jgi:UDP-glucose 4-epimerase
MVQSPLQNPLVIVTGGAGFIGSHTVDELARQGCQVVVVDDLSTGKRANLAQWADNQRVEIVVADVADGLFAPLAPVIARRGPVQRIVHLAAQTSVTRSVESPLTDIRVNYVGTLQVLEYARAMNVRSVVFSSSAAVYGDVEELPVRESMPTRPLSPYGIDKRASEMLLEYYWRVHGLPSTAFRFFNVFGPRQDPRSPYSGVISVFADRAMAGSTINVFGDGEQTRDFIYVADIARAIVTACMSQSEGFATANLGTGVETSVNQLAGLVIDVCRSKSGVEHLPARAGEIARSVAAIDCARELLATGDQRYEVSSVPLARGLSDTLDWVRQAH